MTSTIRLSAAALFLAQAAVMGIGSAHALPSRIAAPSAFDADRIAPLQRMARGALLRVATLREALRSELRQRRAERVADWIANRVDGSAREALVAASRDPERYRDEAMATARLLAVVAARAAKVEPAAGAALQSATGPVLVPLPGYESTDLRRSAERGSVTASTAPDGVPRVADRTRRIGNLRRELKDTSLSVAAAVLKLSEHAAAREARVLDPEGSGVSSLPPPVPMALPWLRLRAADGLVRWERAAAGERETTSDPDRRLETGRDGTVRAVAAGRVVFAGRFRDQGPLLIMAHRNGYHSVVSGLGRLSVASGQRVEAGAVVGTAADRASPPILRLRKGMAAVDPGRWMAGRVAEGRG